MQLQPSVIGVINHSEAINQHCTVKVSQIFLKLHICIQGVSKMKLGVFYNEPKTFYLKSSYLIWNSTLFKTNFKYDFSNFLTNFIIRWTWTIFLNNQCPFFGSETLCVSIRLNKYTMYFFTPIYVYRLCHNRSSKHV